MNASTPQYDKDNNSLDWLANDLAPITVKIAQMQIGKSPEVLQALSVGSCVVITLFDPILKIGGLSHAMLPHLAKARRQSRNQPKKFVDSAIPLMIKELVLKEAKQDRLVAKLAGGAKRLEKLLDLEVGKRNIQSARIALKKVNIPIVAEDVGKNFGRTVLFDLSSGKLLINVEGRRKEL